MTEYNGTTPCTSCGKALPPSYAAYSDECWSCKNVRLKDLKEKRMVP